MQKHSVEVARRDKPGVKEFVPWDGLAKFVTGKLEEIQVGNFISYLYMHTMLL